MADKVTVALRNAKSLLRQFLPGFYTSAVQAKLRWTGMLLDRQVSRIRKASSGVSVLYLSERFPSRPARREQYAAGGAVKMTYLSEVFPHSYPSADILYAVSSVGHAARPQIIARARKQGLKIIVNQNGVAYPAWHGTGWEAANRGLKEILDQADYILYQSRFCQKSAERFLHPPNVPSEVLYNAVDTEFFSPLALSERPPSLSLLLGGNQRERYRLELAIRVLKAVVEDIPDARLVVTGGLGGPQGAAPEWTQNLLRDLALEDRVTFTGFYAQTQAPMIFQRAHVLLHTQYNDASPTLVLEAMACGLPIVYVGSGGVPELVGEAGIGIPVEASWDEIHLPDPSLMGRAVVQVMAGYRQYSELARERVVSQFSLRAFIDRHRQVFMKVLNTR